MSIAYKEGLKIPPSAISEMIQAANQDVRQVSHFPLQLNFHVQLS